MAKSTSDWVDVIKLVRSALFEKRPFVMNDTAERNQVQKCLDVIQKSIRITSSTSMKERLETITRQLNLKLKVGATNTELFIFTEMVLVEIQLNPETGQVLDVKISHANDPSSSCPEITEALNNSDFIEFTKHLEELSSLYQMNNLDKKQKQKAYQALHALEADLSTLAQLQSNSINDPNNLVHKSPVGILEDRKGGHPMKLTYFISPYDLLDLKTKSSVPLTIDVVIKKKLGYSAAVCIESSSSHKLQTVSLISVTKTAEGKSLPQFAALSNLNSSSLPACFVLRLPKQLPMSIETLQKIQAITGIEIVSSEVLANRKPLVNLIAKNLLPENETRHMASHHGPYFVQLPDQCHSYYMNDSLGSLEGVEVSSIPFIHPTWVPQILVFLRQQVLFNVIICSCIRRVNYSCEMEPLIFEVTAFSISTINVSFEHPVEESLATAEIDLRDITNVKCKLHDPGSFSSLCSDDHVSKVLQRCFSIPVTMRAILSKCTDNAKVLRENQDKQKTRVLQQRNHKDVFSTNFNENDNENTDSSSYLPQQLLNSCHYQQKMDVLNENEIYGKGTANGSLSAYSRSQKCSTTNSTAEGILTSKPDSQPKDSSLMSSKSNINQTGSGINFNAHPSPRLQNNQIQNFPAQQQEHLRQKMALQGAPTQQTNQLQNRALQQPFQRSQMHSQGPQNKQNTMLMSMLSDLPAANSSQTANATAYNQSGQAINSIQSQATKPRPQRKRKVANDPGNKSPIASVGRSPKRKMSEDDFSREIPTPSSEFIESFSENHVPNYAKNPSSDVPALAGHEMTFPNAPRSLDSLLVGSRNDAGLGNCVQNLNPNDPALDILSNHQIYSVASLPLNRSQSFSGIGPGQGASQAQLNNDMPWDEASGGRMKKGLKRLKSFEECNDNETFQLNQINEINLDEPQLIINALNDLHPMPDSSGIQKQFPSLMAKPRAVGTKGPVGADNRRCISTGADNSSTNKRSGGLVAGNGLTKPMEDTATSVLKKERKRKRAESLDSVKAGAVSTTAVLMPPPLITTTGEVASSGGNSYAFSDICANGNPQTLSPVTFRPMVSPANSNGPLSKAKKGGVTPPGTASPKSRLADRSLNRSPKGFSPKGDAGEVNGNTNYSPKSSPKTNIAKSGKARGPDPNNPTLKSNKAQSLKSKMQNTSSLGCSSTPGLSSPSFTQGPNAPKNSINIPMNSPVSSSSSNLTSPSSTSCSKTQTGNPKSLMAQKKKQQSLNAVIDKLRNNPSIGDGSSSIDLLSSDRDMIVNKSEIAITKPDSSSGKQAISTANVTSSINKTSEAKKYSRSIDQFTMKPSPGNTLKFTVTKTKPSTASDFKNKKHLPGSFGHKSSNSAVPPGALKSSKNPLGLKRSLTGGVNKAGSNFKVSGSGQTNITKANSSASNPRGGSMGGRNLSNKVSSSNSINKQKITSSEGISDAAFNRIKIDHLPKIPRTASSMAAAHNNNNNNNMNPSSVQNNSGSNNPSTGIVNCPSSSTAPKESESNTQIILNSGTSLNPNSGGLISANQMNATGSNRFNSAVSQNLLNSSPQNLVITQSSSSSNYSSQPSYCPSKRPILSNPRDSFSNSSHLYSSSSPAIPSSSERMVDNTPPKFQSCTISSSFPSVNTPSANSSDSSSTHHLGLTLSNDQIVSLKEAHVVGEIPTVMSNSSSGVTSSVHESEFKVCDSNEVVGARNSIRDPIDQEKSGVSSSSDNKLSTSTPSSPVECSIIPDVLQKPPPLIPTESIEDPNLPEIPESQIDSSIGFVSSSPSPGILRKSSLPGNGSRLSSSSHVASSSDVPGKSSLAEGGEEVDDDDDEEDGLIIDFTSSTPTKKDISVSSTALSLSKNTSNESLSSSSKSLIQEPDPSLSSSSLDEDQHTEQAGLSCPISSSVEQASSNNTNPNFSSIPSSSSSLSNHVSESPSNQSISSLTSAPRRSPCLIDDELMDEALVGSGE